MRAIRLLAATAVASIAAASAYGDSVRIFTNAANVNVGGTYTGSNGGGGFRAVFQGTYIGSMGGRGGDATSFITFCIERTETLANNTLYNTNIATSAKLGGGGNEPDPDEGGTHDPINGITAALYREFRTGGTFGGLVAGAWSSAASTALQLAIWNEEEELAINPSLVAAYNANALAQNMHAWAVSNDVGIGNVRVLRLYAQNGNNAQDVLTMIPLPSAAGLACIGLLAVRPASRRRRSL